MYILLKTQPEVLAKYQHKFRDIMIDEYQDTNPAKYEIIKLLGDVHQNTGCVVGDDAQSIYSFQAGRPSKTSCSSKKIWVTIRRW